MGNSVSKEETVSPLPHQWAEGQMCEGWITITPLSDEHGPAVYGIFEDQESALNWAKNCLPNTIVRPIFTPVFSKG